jgi:hypothetical protein
MSIKNYIRKSAALFLAFGLMGFTLSAGATAPEPTPTPVAQHTYGTIWDESFFYIPGYVSGPTAHQAPTGDPALHGVPTDNAFLGQEYDAGVRTKNVYIRWRLFEPAEGNTTNDYITEKQEEIRKLREKGYSVILRINPFPVPEWLFTAVNPVQRLKNQYGVEWMPEAFGNTPDSMASIWDDNYKTYFRNYVQRVFEVLGTNFHAVYLTVGQYGEVAFPIHDFDPKKSGDRPEWKEDYSGNVNCYWAWDSKARANLETRYQGDGELAAIRNFVPGAGAGVGERLVNGGFEDHTVNGVAYYYQNLGTIPNWGSAEACLNQGAWSPAVMTGGAHDGTRYLRYQAPSGLGYYLRQDVPVNPGTAYQLPGWVRAESGSAGNVRIYTRDAQGNTAVALTQSISDTSWMNITANLTTPADCRLVYVDLAITTAGGGTGSADFDGLSLMDTAHPVAAHSVAEKFLNWYHQSLADFANWQIDVLKQIFTGKLILMEGGYAGRSGDIEAEINNDLSGATKNNYWVRRGFVPDRYLPAIGNKVNVYFANTAVEQSGRAFGESVNNQSPLQSDWSAPYYMAFLADRMGFGKWAENSGWNNAVAMSDAFANMDNQNYVGLGWYTAGQLTYSQGQDWASVQDFKNNVQARGCAAEPEGYYEGFVGTVGNALPGWTTVASTLLCAQSNEVYAGRMTIASASENEIASPVIKDLNVREYFDTLEVKVSQVNGTAVKVGIKDKQGRYYWAPEIISGTGVFTQKVHPFTWDAGPVDMSEFKVVFKKDDSASAGSLDCEYVKLIKTDRSMNSYLDHFWGLAGQKPSGWQDAYNAAIRSDGTTDGVLQLGAGNTFGDVTSPIFRSLDVNANDRIEFKLDSISAGANVTVQFVEVHADGTEGTAKDVYNSLRAPGVYRLRMSDFSSQMNLSRFLIKVWIAGTAGSSQAKFDYFKIYPTPGSPAGFADDLNGPANQVPFGWRDSTNSPSSNSSVLGDGASNALLKVLGNGTYGDVVSPIVYDLDTNQYGAVEFKVSAVSANAYVDLGVQEERGAYRYFGAFGHIDEPGVYRKRLSSFAGTADLSAFSVKHWINGPSNQGQVTLDYLKIVPVVPIPTVTVTGAYEEHFTGAAQELPQGWRDLTTFEENNVMLKGDGSSRAVLKLKNNGTYGDVMSPIIVGLNTQTFNIVEITLNDITSGGWLDIGVQQETGARIYYPVFAHMDTPGMYRINLNTVAPGADLSQFSLKFWINGTAGTTNAILDSVRVRTMPPVPTVTPTAQGYAEYFTGPRYFAPTGWRDQYTYIENNTAIRGDGDTGAEIKLIGSSQTYGDVISPVIAGLDTQTFDTLEIKSTSITADSYVDIGVQEESGSFRYFPAFSHLTAAGTYTMKLSDVAAGANLSQFSIKFWLNGPAGTAALTLDSVRVFHGEYASVLNWLKTTQSYPRWPMAGVSAVGLGNGNVLLSGGVNANNQQPIYSGYIYSASSHTYSYVGDFNYNLGRASHTSTLLTSGQVLLAGGTRYGATLSEALLYNGIGFSRDYTNMVSARVLHTATRLANGNVLMAGGYNNSSAEIYNPGANQFTATGAMSKARYGHTATLLANGKVLIAGGPDNTTELYDPANGTFSPGPNMISGGGNQAVTLANGKVLIIFNSAVPAELYDPSANTFSQTGTMSTRVGGIPVLLSNGKVAVAGEGTAVEVYDPNSGQFTSGTNMPEGTRGSVMGLISNGAFFSHGRRVRTVPRCTGLN